MVELYIPRLEDFWFRKEMMETPETMSYNKNWEVSYQGYHPETGCIDFPESEWQACYERLIGKEPKQFYAYIRRKSDGAFLGEVCFHETPEKNWHDMGIVIHAPFRGMGYAVPALKLLTDRAFGVAKIERLHNDFEIARHEVAAWRTHFSAGFREYSRENGWLSLMMTKEYWLSQMDFESDEDSFNPYDSFRIRF